MNYVEFEAGNKAYKLRINTRNVIQLEKAIGGSALSIFDLEGETLPTFGNMVAVLHASLQQYHHGISVSDAYDIFDAYIADGHSVDEFIYVILDIYKESGIIPKEADNEKN